MSGTIQTVIVGQKMELLVRTRPSEAMSNLQWTVPGERVRDYIQTPSQGFKLFFGESGLQAVNLDFYWIAGGSQTVQIAAIVRGTRLSAQVTHDVLAPTSVSMTSLIGSVQVGDQPGRTLSMFYGHDEGDMPFQGRFNRGGITWYCSAIAPAGGDGEIAATQLINADRERTDNSGIHTACNTGGAFWLDTRTPYDTAVPISAGKQTDWTSRDSPANLLFPSYSKTSASDAFRLYFMYKPAGADSIWVTLMRLDWHWAGETTRVGAPTGLGNRWKPPTRVSPLKGDPAPLGVATTELPKWEGNFEYSEWA